MLSSDYLLLTHGHRMYFETHGNSKGPVVVILHGGPGGSLVRNHLKHFNLRKWHVILYDQRGCGKSTPSALEYLAHNTTWDLVDDIERLRKHLTIDKWTVFGGSWGTTLGLIYAETYPERVSSLILRSVCLGTCEDDWLYGGGTAMIYPKEWQKFISLVQAPYTAKNIIKTYRKLLTGPDPRSRKRAAILWTQWEDSVSFLRPKKSHSNMNEIMAVAILENHYFYHDSWLKPNQIITNAHKLKNIPISITHGRYDVVCPLTGSWILKQALPHAKLVVVADAGHASMEPGTRKALRRLTNKTLKA